MHDVVRQPLGRAELLQPLQVLGYVAVQALLGLVEGARTEVDDAGVVAQVDDLWVVRVVRPGVDVDGVSAGAELPGYLEHVHVHAARILPAEAGHGTAVHAQHGYSIHEALRCAGRAGEAGRTGVLVYTAPAVKAAVEEASTANGQPVYPSVDGA